ncbi:uncharacterized protein LOC131648522 [Vicia villosa]|uniref:uncharacterized protein LOC131648522 n=1 Tax=Vicia villosa TaxID=3911 RepID=UPI00273C4512|nr:uncharacterized protein LOC131648522 [Vicia villosa]
MIIYSLNIRGEGKLVKRKRVGFNIQRGKVDIAFIQETKLRGVQYQTVKELWGDALVEWSHVDAEVASGGMLIMWRKDFFNLIYSFRGDGFLGICVEKDNRRIYFVNIYAACDHKIRLRSWRSLLDLKRRSSAGSWCIRGDFNLITSLNERVGISKKNYRKEIEDFKEFIEEMELVDPPTIGGKFTWRNICGSAMSRLDRFLLLDKFIDDWKVEGQTIGERDVSDHAPIWMKDNKRNWGPKSFRFNNLWFNHDNFIHFVEVEWKKIVVMGRGDFCLVEKLKALKSQIVKWNKEVYGWINLNIEEAGKEMHFLDNKFAHFAGNVSEEVVVERSIVAIDFWDNLCKKEGFLRQKLRQLLLTEGDCNTCYFHNSLKDRRRRNSLCALDSRGGILKKVSEVKGFIFNHFKSFFNEEAEGRPNLSGLSLKALSGWESLNIERLFTELEVKDAIWSCDGNKSAGPDALIPKINNTQNLGEYLPICLVGSIYRIISKILAARLKEVIGTLVSNNQTAFVSGRNMMDSVLLVNELIDWSRRKKRSCILLNVDFEKAYDSVSWKYLRDMMMRMGFGDMWMRWMDTCIFMSHMSVLVNGSATKEFKVHKGLRQGDPLSPFLFVLAMKGLKALVRKSIEMGDLKPFNYGEEDYVDILQFADDTIILGEDSCDNLWNMKVLLRGFELVSGLKTNFAKSNILGVNVGDWFINATTTFLSCKKGGIPFKFLGIMVGESLRKKKVWLEVINKIKGRLSSWKGSNISMGGRVPLINLVLNAIPTFTLSFFKAPGKVIKEIRRLQSDFLWSEKLDKKSIHWVKWKNVCRSKEKGGLGVRDVGEVNKALLLKWKWRILRKDNAIWSRFLLLRYHCPKLKVQVPSGEMSRSDDSIWWRDINKNNVIDDLVDSGFTGCYMCCCKNGKYIFLGIVCGWVM